MNMFTNSILKPGRLILLSFAMMVAASPAFAKPGNGNGGGNGGGGGGPDPVFVVESTDPTILAPESYSLDRGEQIVFRDADMDLGQFDVTYQGGGDCDHGPSHGTLVLKPKSSNNPSVAVLSFWFQAALEFGEPGDTVMHQFYMEGEFDEPDNWPPSEAYPETTVTFDYWEIRVENKKAQRNDCAGESATVPDPNGPWTITVMLKD
jgi:hypothetical protein